MAARRKTAAALIGPADDWWYNACVNYMPDHIWAYATGYKEAADVLVAKALEKRYHLDTFVYPILFLYRHYLELRMKELIKSGNSAISKPVRVPNDHRLDNLWGVCRRILLEVWPDGDEYLRSTDKCIREFSKIDPTSEAFRYSRLRRGQKSLQGVTHINLRKIRDVMEEVSALLDGASYGIDEYRRFVP